MLASTSRWRFIRRYLALRCAMMQYVTTGGDAHAGFDDSPAVPSTPSLAGAD